MIKQGTIKDFGIETITSQELINKIINVHGMQAAIVSSSTVDTNNITNQQQQQAEQPITVSEQTIDVSSSSPSTIVTADENNKAK